MKFTISAGISATNPPKARNRPLTRTLLYPVTESREEMGYIRNYYSGSEYCGTHEHMINKARSDVVRPRADGEFLPRAPMRDGNFDNFARTARNPFF